MDKNALDLAQYQRPILKLVVSRKLGESMSGIEGCEKAGQGVSNSSSAKLSRRCIARHRGIAVAQIIVLLLICGGWLSDVLKLRQGLQSAGHLGQRVVRD